MTKKENPNITLDYVRDIGIPLFTSFYRLQSYEESLNLPKVLTNKFILSQNLIAQQPHNLITLILIFRYCSIVKIFVILQSIRYGKDLRTN